MANHWWATIAGGWARYDGHNTWDNQALNLDLAAGRSWKTADAMALTTGIFLAGQHFQRNSNYFTFGHGGYFSPQVMTLIGPFVRLRSDLCNNFWHDLRAPAGWLHLVTDDSPIYLLHSDAGGQYLGERLDQAAFSLKGEVWQQLTSHLAIGAFAGLDNATDYLEWVAGLTVCLHFRGQHGFWKHADSFQAHGACRNR